MSKEGLCDLFSDTESQPHFVITEHNLNKFLNNLHISLNYYLNIVTGDNRDQKNNIVRMLETSQDTFSIIYKCIDSNTPALSPAEKKLLINLSRAIIYDTEHDFGSGSSRGNCKNDVIKSCLSSFQKLKNYTSGGIIPSLNDYAINFFSNNRKPVWLNDITTFNNCADLAYPDSIDKEAIKNLSDIKYYLQDSAVHKKAKTAFLMSGGKTIYRAISSAIDPAGCKNEKQHEYNVADHVNIKYELIILNISLIFYQNFYTIFQHLQKFFYMEISSNRNDFKMNKRFNINIINLNDGTGSQITNVIGGSNCNYSPQKICDILSTKKSSMDKLLKKYYNNIPLNDPPRDYLFARALQLILKGHGDFGQIFWSMFLYYTHNDRLPSDFYQNINANFQKFYNNCLIQTGDKYFACISAILKAPVLIGTTGDISMYIINSNIKYYNENIIESYNKYNDLKSYDSTKDGIDNFTTNITYIQQSDENSVESIINENAYNKYYNDNIIRFFIVKNADGSFTLIECGIENDKIVILYNITDMNYWYLNPTWITRDERYSNASNETLFNQQRSVVKDSTYYDLVNIKIFSWYSRDFIVTNLPIIIGTTNDIIFKLNYEKERARDSDYGDIYPKTIDYIYYIIQYGVDTWIKNNNGSLFEGSGPPPPARIRSITANNKTFENINNNLKILIKFSEVIQNLLNVMYENLKLLNDHFTRIYKQSYLYPDDKLLLYTINIIEVYIEILRNDFLSTWIESICQYSKENKEKFPFKDQFTHDINYDNEFFKNEMVRLNSYTNIKTPDEIIIFGFVKDFGNNISILSSSCLLIITLHKKLKNLSSEIHIKLIDTLNAARHATAQQIGPESPQVYTQSGAIKFLGDNKLPDDPEAHQLPVDEDTYSQSLDTIYEMTNPDKKECIEYCQDYECSINTTNNDMTIYLIKYMDNISASWDNLKYYLSIGTGYNKINFIALNMQTAYEEIYRRLTLIYFFKDIYSTLQDDSIDYINSVWEYISKQHFQNINIIREYLNTNYTTFLVDENREILAYSILNIFESPEIKDKNFKIDELNIAIKKKIKELIYLDFKKNYNYDNDDLKVKSLVEDDVLDDGDSSFNVDIWLSSQTGGSLYDISKNNSNKLKIYLKNIENITEKIKLLKKNKIKNKDKIRQENNNIKKLKLKIKNESKKEKEKEKEKQRKQKQKEKEKQRKQKIIQKEKQKKEIEIEKQRKEKEKTKQKKQKEIEKEKQKKEINKNKEKEKQRKQKEKQKKEIEKDKQRKQKIIQKEKQKKEIEIQKQQKQKEKTKQKTKQKKL